MRLKPSEIYSGFRVRDEWEIEEIKSTAYLMEHLQSGARLLYLKNDDDNKVFSVTFRTPPADSCGTPHIMEHSVLCGSKKYPLKEPFVELIKSSMNTFLNAMTFPDKTMYPVASRNHADFLNLMDVYCDAVFNPLVKENIYTFYQEGWHHHLEHPEDPITVNGVVYNEMKGAFSEPEEILMRYVQASLYPDTPYAFESGGDPDVIPSLTYEKFLDYYHSYYHPSNSYLYFYGDMDILVCLKKLNDEYLSEYSRIEVKSLPDLQKPFVRPTTCELQYSVGEEDTEEGRCYFAANFKIGNANDTLLSYSFNVLSNILFDSDASPLKKALMDAGIADEITSDYTTAVREPYFSVIAKNAKKEQYQTFLDTIETTLRELTETGIDSAVIRSALNSYEFDLREADSGNYPKGLIYNMDVMESWLYDAKPGIHLQYEACLQYLREHETSEYYCDLIKQYFLDNPHHSNICLIPKKNLERGRNIAMARKLENLKESFSEQEIFSLVDTTNELLRRQNQTDSEEAKNTIPVIALTEVDRNLPAPDFSARNHRESTVYFHADKTSGIVYADIDFPMNPLSSEELPICGLLTKVLGVYSTEHFSELELANQIGTYLGDIDVTINTHQSVADPNAFEARFVFFAKALNSNAKKMFELCEEILLTTRIDNTERVYKTICEEISKFENKILGASHQFVLGRLQAMLFPRGAYNEACTGVAYYRYLLRVKREIEQGNDDVLANLNRVCAALVNTYQTDLLMTGEAEEKERLLSLAERFIDRLPLNPYTKVPISFEAEDRMNEGIILPSRVMYVGMGNNYKLLGHEFTPQLIVAKKYLTSGYLWDKIRLVGGAYGALMSLDKNGTLAFISYRDPNLRETIDAYHGIAEHLRTASFTERDIHKLIIGTISDLDMPVPVYTTGRRMLHNLYKEDTWENQQANRDGVLSVTVRDLNGLADLFDAWSRHAILGVAGEETKLKENEVLFGKIYSITRTE